MTVTVKLSKPGILPEGVELSVKTLDKDTEGYNYEAYIDALNEKADEIAGATGEDEATEYNDDNTVLFDIAFMLDGIEYEPKDGTVKVSIYFNNKQISDGLGTENADEMKVVHLQVSEEIMQDLNTTSEATQITASDIAVEVLSEGTVNLGTSTDLVMFETDSFSVYGVIKPSSDGTTWTGSNYYSAKEIVGWLGNSTYFGVVADTYDGGSNHSEANIAVREIDNIQNFTIGISTKVYTELDEYTITVIKEVTSGLRVGTFNFALYSDAEGKNKIAGTDFSITTDSTGKGKHVGDYGYLLKSGNYPRLYVFELNEDGEAVKEGGLVGSYIVSYDGNAVNAPSDTIGFFADNYVETVGLSSKYSAEYVLEKVDGATIYYPTGWDSYMGVTYYQNQVYGTKPDGTVGWTNYLRTDYEGRMPVNVSDMLSDARTASEKLVYATNSSDVEVVNIVATKENGNLQTDLSTKYFKDSKDPYNYAVNTGFKLSEEKLLVINVDLTGATNYTLQKFTYNGQGTGDWSEAANHVVINLVEKDSSGQYVPYTGKITANIMSGTLIAPDATVTTTSSYSGTIIANKVYKQCEIHKMDVRRYLDDAHTLTVSNKGTNTYPFEITAYKYVDDQTPDQSEVFSFTLGFYDKSTKSWKIIENDLKNDGDTIKYIIEDPSAEPFAMEYGNGSDSEYFFLLTENDTSSDYIKDKTAILVKVKYYPKKDSSGNTIKDISEINYYRVPEDGVNSVIYSNNFGYNSDDYRIKAEKEATKGKLYSKVAFFNTNTKSTMLRIHKLVVNDFGSDFVRDGKGTWSGLLSNVKFRITNNSTGNYIVFTGFTGTAGTKGTATEYDKKSHKETGKTYVVTYNQSAQWTIEGLPAGTYTVDEVADGLTFTYDPADNYSVLIDNEYHLTRVTQYDVTVDDEETGKTSYGTGGENYRKVFAVDLNGKTEAIPTDVSVGGGAIRTVQVCNYYSIPIGPIQVTKNFSGGKWPDGVSFTFDIEKAGFTAYDSAGNELKLSADTQPMPDTTEVSVSASDAKYDEKTGLYTAIADFGHIPFRYEGTYYYKITENATNAVEGIKYDSTTYYLKVVVSKKYTQFTKKYNYDKMTHPEKYTADTTLLEDFWYLGADVTYATDQNFSNIVAQCELYLGIDPNTGLEFVNDFGTKWTVGGLESVAFNNSLVGNLTVSKEWLDAGGQDDKANHTSLTLYIWQSTDGKKWTVYQGTTIQLSASNNWTQTVTGLPLTDCDGNAYMYTVKEPDEYLSTYHVTYSFNGQEIDGNSQKKVEVKGVPEGKGKDLKAKQVSTGYVMSKTDSNNSFGTVTITNRKINTNALPSTGGTGNMPYAATGSVMVILALLGYIFIKKQDSKERKNEGI